MTIIQKLKQIEKIGSSVEVPYEVYRFLAIKNLSVMGSEISLSNDGDYGSLKECRTAVDWLVEQLGGQVKWRK